jgi:hypothetical protein
MKKNQNLMKDKIIKNHLNQKLFQKKMEENSHQSRSVTSSTSSSFVLGSGQHLAIHHAVNYALSSYHSKRVVLGVLAMDKKTK